MNLRSTPIIAVTASALIDEESRAGFVGFIRKPFMRRDILDERYRYLCERGDIDTPFRT